MTGQITIGRFKIDQRLMIISALALAKLLIHLYTNAFAGYGIFRDELYYLACADRLDIGYVDQPPLSLFILRAIKIIIGDSLFAIRLAPAISGSLTVFFSGLIARRLGGGNMAVFLAGLATIAAPIMMAMNTIYSMNCIDILLWAVTAYTLILIVDRNRPQYWIIFGLLIGLGLLNKISMGWFAAGALIAFIVTPQRKSLLTVWPYAAAALAFAIFSPYIIWNFTHDFAHLEFIRNATASKYAGVTPIDFLAGQILLITPVSVFLWIAGLYYFLFDGGGKKYKTLGISLLTVVFILIINGHSKPEYLAATYPVLFAGGAIVFENVIRRRYFGWLKIVFPVMVAAAGIVMAPFAIPIMPVEKFIAYSRATGVTVESNEGHKLTDLPQFYADMFGWENLAKTVSAVYQSLPDEEKGKTLILAKNYGEAGAVEYYDKKYPLAPVYAPHNNYWIWGEEHYGKDYQTLIVIGGRGLDPAEIAEEYEQAATIRCRYCISYENELPVYICRKLKFGIEEARKRFKVFI